MHSRPFRGRPSSTMPHILLSSAALRSSLLAVLFVGAGTEAGVVAHFTANGTPNDATGGHLGELVNGAGYDDGVEGQAFAFNGSQWVSSPNSTDWHFGDAPFTISVWANLDVVHVGPDGLLPNVLVGCDDASGTNFKWVFYLNGSGGVGFHVNGSSFQFLVAPTGFVPAPGDWHHYAMVRQGTAFTFFVDGASLGTVIADFPMPTPKAPLTIGQAESLGLVVGRIDDVQIYDAALTATQVQALFESPGAEVSTCAADFNGDGVVDGNDLGALLGFWGPCDPRSACSGDLNGDDLVNGNDLGALLGLWGPCSL